MSEALLESLRRAALEGGLVGFGVCSADPFPSVKAQLEARVADGSSGRLRFTFARPDISTDVRRTFPWAKRLVVAASSYLPSAGDPGPARPQTARIARFAVEDPYPPLREALEKLAGMLREAGHQAEVLVDDNRLVDRAAAVRAGVGWWGKSSMVLAPRYGPYLVLGSLATDARLPTSQPMRRSCGSCTACLPACPTGALVAPGILDARRCLAHWAQVPGVIPIEFREPMGDRLYGCDDCLDACPPGRHLLGEVREVRRGRVDLIDLLRSADRSLLVRFAHFYIPRRQSRYLRRNALVALGNTGGPDAVPVLAGYVGHPDPLLRIHAAWALGRLPSAASRAALGERLAQEHDPQVRHELQAARAAQK
ncbi:MAG: tRNA epoxyqueuosine(34) reductase QueG [Actinomycetota bacterium]|nr:tRNA epoxyqueuosine(34) reductase QueG [Actinomycetota bacterium]